MGDEGDYWREHREHKERMEKYKVTCWRCKRRFFADAEERKSKLAACPSCGEEVNC